jgi:hypothetical protein
MLGHNAHLIAFVRAVVVRRPFLRPTVDEVRRKFEVMYRQLFPAPAASSSLPSTTAAAASSSQSSALSLSSSSLPHASTVKSSALQFDVSPPAWLSALLHRRVDDATVNVDESAASSSTAASQTPVQTCIHTATHASELDNLHVAAVTASVAHSVRAAAADLVSATAIDARCGEGDDDGDGNDGDSKANAAAAATRKQMARRVSAASASVSASAAAPFYFEPSSSSVHSDDSGGQTLPSQAPFLVATMSSHAAAASTAEPKSQSSASSSSSTLVAARATASTAASSSSASVPSSSSSSPTGSDAPHDAWRGPLLRTVSTAAPNLLFGMNIVFCSSSSPIICISF